MPCHDPRADEDLALLAKIREGLDDYHKAQIRFYQDKVDKLTSMLCQCLQMMDTIRPDLNMGDAAFLSDEIRDWWQEHKKWDRERKK